MAEIFLSSEFQGSQVHRRLKFIQNFLIVQTYLFKINFLHTISNNSVPVKKHFMLYRNSNNTLGRLGAVFRHYKTFVLDFNGLMDRSKCVKVIVVASDG
jgi:hypothetical protein